MPGLRCFRRDEVSVATLWIDHLPLEYVRQKWITVLRPYIQKIIDENRRPLLPWHALPAPGVRIRLSPHDRITVSDPSRNLCQSFRLSNRALVFTRDHDFKLRPIIGLPVRRDNLNLTLRVNHFYQYKYTLSVVTGEGIGYRRQIDRNRVSHYWSSGSLSRNIDY